ncbi:MAG: T9SS type A sorting domain-containing protein, partial [Bacteroidota bacterium]
FTVDLSEIGLPAGGGGELRLVDLHGREIWTRQVSTNQPTLPVALAQPRAGVYLLIMVTGEGQTVTQRIVIR